MQILERWKPWCQQVGASWTSFGPGVNRDVNVNVQGPSCLSGCYVVDPCIDLKGKSGIWSTQYVGVVWATSLRSPSKKMCIYMYLFYFIFIYIYIYILYLWFWLYMIRIVSIYVCLFLAHNKTNTDQLTLSQANSKHMTLHTTYLPFTTRTHRQRQVES